MRDSTDYAGLLVIGDPHLEGRTPGFRKDDYPSAILEKLRWGLDYATEQRLLPAILGDLFDKPRDNPTWMLGSLIELFGRRECLALYGNHDCADPELSDHDSFSLLVKSGRVRLLDGNPWRGTFNGRRVIVGGSSYRHAFPDRIEHTIVDGEPRPIGIWLAHHDLIVPGYEEMGRVQPREIPGIDLVINGHIHRRLKDVQIGQTVWTTPGNITRRSRSDANREHVPAMLRVGLDAGGYTRTFVEVPHLPFDEVFHASVGESSQAPEAGSAFVAGLAELQARRTASGAGLMAFLEKNLGQFDQPIADEILSLSKEVTNHG